VLERAATQSRTPDIGNVRLAPMTTTPGWHRLNGVLEDFVRMPEGVNVDFASACSRLSQRLFLAQREDATATEFVVRPSGRLSVDSNTKAMIAASTLTPTGASW
jgi:hypothetical protein